MYIRILPWSLLLAASTAVGMPPPTPEEAASEVREARRTGKVAELRTLASRESPDPWLVADALCAREQFDVAVEFVLAAPRLDTAQLREAIDATRESPPSADDRAKLKAALGSRDKHDALALLAAIDVDTKSLFGARVLAERAHAADTAEAHRAAAMSARYLGWLRLAADSEIRASLRFESDGKLADAVAAARARLEIETRRGRSARLADALVEAGRLSLVASELPEAEDLLRRALRQSERQKSAPLKAKSERYLGLTLAARGAGHDGRIYLLRAFEDYRALDDRKAMLAALEPVMTLDGSLDGIPRGLKRAEEALALARSLEDRAAEGRVLAAMGRMERERKAWAEAVVRFDAAQAAFRSAGAIGAAGKAAYSSGVLSLRMGQRDAARASLTRAAADAKSTEDAALQANVQSELGDLALELGQVEAAARHLESAAKLAETAQNPTLAARALSRLGRLALRRDKPKEARKRLEEALKQIRAIPNNSDEVRTLLALGEAERRLGQRERAERIADEVAAIARRDQLPGVLARAAALRAEASFVDGATAEQAAAAFEVLRTAARDALALLEKSNLASTPRFEADFDRLLRVGVDMALTADDVALILTVCEYRRSRAMLASLGGRRALIRVLTSGKLRHRREASTKAEEAATAEYERARQRMDKNAMLAARARVQKARAETAQVDKAIDARLAPAKSLFAPGITPMADIQAALAPSESVLYFCAGVDSISVVIVTRGGSRTVALGARRDLDAAAYALQQALGQPDPRAAIASVRRLLLDPLRIAETSRDLVIIPVSPVDRIPICLLDEKVTVRYCDSAAFLVAAERMARQRGTGVVSVGNSRFANAEIRSRLEHLGSGIPDRRLETGKNLAELFSDTVIVGSPTTESRVRDALAMRDRWQAIHFTAPFLIDRERPYASLLGLAPEGKNDGVLDLYELMRMGLRTELTLLAACEPSRGDRDVGPALRAVARGIQLSGSARVIASRWWIDDDAALNLMGNFYRFWRNRETSAPLALRRAQFKVTTMHGWTHPKHWAGWQLWGAR